MSGAIAPTDSTSISDHPTRARHSLSAAGSKGCHSQRRYFEQYTPRAPGKELNLDKFSEESR
jgi:hypothetical protein